MRTKVTRTVGVVSGILLLSTLLPASLLAQVALTITTNALPTGTQGLFYGMTIGVTGGTSPYTRTITAGALPAGLSLDASSGLISGTPSTAGTSTFTVQVTDFASGTTTKNLSITIYSSLAITTGALPSGNQGVAYTASISASGGTTPYAWSIVSGTLPAGLSLDANSGIFSGTPSVTGTSGFTVQVQDSLNSTATVSVSIVINTGRVTLASYNFPSVGPLDPSLWFEGDGGLLTQPAVNAPGSGYLIGDVSVVLAGDQKALIRVNGVDNNGGVTDIWSYSPGTGYSVAMNIPTISSSIGSEFMPQILPTQPASGGGLTVDLPMVFRYRVCLTVLAPDRVSWGGSSDSDCSAEAIWNGPGLPNDQWIEGRDNDGSGIYLSVRKQNGDVYCYGNIYSDGTGSLAVVNEPFGGVYSTDYSHEYPFSTAAPSPGDVFRLEAHGDTLAFFRNDRLLRSVTDPAVSLAESGYPLAENVYHNTVSFGTFALPGKTLGDIKIGTFLAPSISLSNNLWYFGQGNTVPPQFNLGATSATLTANGAGAGTYVWTVTSGANGLNFENDSTTITKNDVNTVGIKSIGFSDQANDVTVMLQYTPAGGSQMSTLDYALTIDSPYELVPNGSPSHAAVGGGNCALIPAPDGTNGFQSQIPYNIISRFMKLITNIDINESFGGWTPDYAGNNWALPSAGSFRSVYGFFVDNACVLGFTNPLTLIPQSPLGATKIQHSTQSWFVGSATSGSGIQVQSNTHQRYQDHGAHEFQ